ncbi:MAG: hypothetical protein Q8R69_15450, partial [Telluria sp.]|nr:hypothetical protein [Telluria sp.]
MGKSHYLTVQRRDYRPLTLCLFDIPQLLCQAMLVLRRLKSEEQQSLLLKTKTRGHPPIDEAQSTLEP